jgi:hypothetical protein
MKSISDSQDPLAIASSGRVEMVDPDTATSVALTTEIYNKI